MAKSVPEDSFILIEETQAALRDSISQAKALAEESERLLRAHRAHRAHRDKVAGRPNSA